MSAKTGHTTKPKPLKRPIQARSAFTVQTIYDAFVRIWLREGWDKVTTRKIAIESGFAVGTIYEYFPNKTALLSGYVRHAVEWTLSAIHNQVVEASGHSPQNRLERLVELTIGAGGDDQPYFDQRMILLEEEIAENKDHRRVYREICEAWVLAVKAISDIPRIWNRQDINAIVLILWGARRYGVLLQLSEAEQTVFLKTVKQFIASSGNISENSKP